MAAIPTNVRRIVGVLTVLLLGLFGVVWVGANPLGGGVLLALAFVRLVLLVRELGTAASLEHLRARLATLDRELDGPGGDGEPVPVEDRASPPRRAGVGGALAPVKEAQRRQRRHGPAEPDWHLRRGHLGDGGGASTPSEAGDDPQEPGDDPGDA